MATYNSFDCDIFETEVSYTTVIVYFDIYDFGIEG